MPEVTKTSVKSTEMGTFHFWGLELLKRLRSREIDLFCFFGKKWLDPKQKTSGSMRAVEKMA